MTSLIIGKTVDIGDSVRLDNGTIATVVGFSVDKHGYYVDLKWDIDIGIGEYTADIEFVFNRLVNRQNLGASFVKAEPYL